MGSAEMAETIKSHIVASSSITEKYKIKWYMKQFLGWYFASMRVFQKAWIYADQKSAQRHFQRKAHQWLSIVIVKNISLLLAYSVLMRESFKSCSQKAERDLNERQLSIFVNRATPYQKN